MSTLGRFTFGCGIVGPSGPLTSLGVLLGESRGRLQRLGQLRQDRRSLLRALPRMSNHQFGSAYFAVRSIRIDQLGPSTL